MTNQKRADADASPLALDHRALDRLIRKQRISIGLSLADAAAQMRLPTDVLVQLEEGESISTEALFTVLRDFGLAMSVAPKPDAIDAFNVVHHAENWRRMPSALRSEKDPKDGTKPIPDRPTLFLDLDALHAGNAVIDEADQIALDSGRPLLEFAPFLVDILRPCPSVEIVLTTSWLQKLPLDRIFPYLPPDLAQRVVDTTKDIKPRNENVRNSTARTYVIVNYVYGKHLKNWLAIDDSVYGAYNFGSDDEVVEHFVLLDSSRGISDPGAQLQIQTWLEQL